MCFSIRTNDSLRWPQRRRHGFVCFIWRKEEMRERRFAFNASHLCAFVSARPPAKRSLQSCLRSPPAARGSARGLSAHPKARFLNTVAAAYNGSRALRKRCLRVRAGRTPRAPARQHCLLERAFFFSSPSPSLMKSFHIING